MNKDVQVKSPRSEQHPRQQSNSTELSVEEIVARRAGDVLLRHTILKSDHFPGCQNTKLTPLIEGAPNYRQVPRIPVYGVAIPTVTGLRRVLDTLGCDKGRRKVLWHNLREEPVLYVNGRPFVVREADKPFANLEYTGIDRERVEDMEIRLKADVLAEASAYGGEVMVAHEDDSFQVVEDWEAVTEVDVQTPAEVYAELVKEGYDVDYYRVPITDEKAPKGDDFEVLISRCWSPPEGAALVFNCQMGRGRTTTGMVIGCLLRLRKELGQLAPPPIAPVHNNDVPEWFVTDGDTPLSPGMASSRAVSTISLASSALEAAEDAELKAGKFTVIRSLLRALDRGRQSKHSLDLVLDACSAMQNLREAIYSYRTRLFFEPNDMRKTALMEVCLEYLERYYVLITFANYLDDPAFCPGSLNHVTFDRWIKARPELRGILLRLLRANPLAALALDRPDKDDGNDEEDGSEGLNKSISSPVGKTRPVNELQDEFEATLATRDGSVLGPRTILKQDHFPGCQAARLPVIVSGAPNFRGVQDDLKVYGGGIATAEGVAQILNYVGAGPQSGKGSDVRAVWHMMREEPVVYIAGQPYVLREESRPFKNLLEYRGIDALRLDSMEQRLRDDVIAEASKHGGKLLVTLETSGTDGGRGLRQVYVSVDAGVVQTPRALFESLQRKGYRVTFIRAPLTDGTSPRPSDFDVFYDAAAAANKDDALIYTCQLGGGRTTTGMAIGTLLRMHLHGVSPPMPSELERKETLKRLDEDIGSASPRGGSDDEEDQDYAQALPFGSAIDLHSVFSTQQTIPEDGIAIKDGDNTKSQVASSERLQEDEDPDKRNLEDGEYVGVRRFTRTLERGSQAKATVDTVVDACGLLINLRTAIMRYRKPKSLDKFFRPELQARHLAFTRGSAYLERYCMLIAFESFLTQCGQQGKQMKFSEWVAMRPDILSAQEFIHQNPAGALAPVPPVPSFTPAPDSIGNAILPVPGTIGRAVTLEDQKKVLFRRRGSTVGRRSILKSFTIANRAPPVEHNDGLLVKGVTDMRQVSGMPVYTMGNATVNGVKTFLSMLDAGPGGPTHVIITDLREELVIYVNGTAYLRRELEMPAAALHHAGIQAAKLEDLERRLRSDMMVEASGWGGNLLLHRELSVETPRTSSIVPAENSTSSDITRTTDYQPTTQVSAFWEAVGHAGDIDHGMCTPCEVFTTIAGEGYQLSYRRVPMSRERTPQAADLDQLQLQMNNDPNGKLPAYLFVSRTADGSSARFAAAFACCYIRAEEGTDAVALYSPGAGGSIYGSSPRGQSILSSGAGSDSDGGLFSGSAIAKRPRGSSIDLRRSDSDLLERSAEAGEYRGIMNVCRVLPGGAELKSAVDEAIDVCTNIGNLREDILRCKEASEKDDDPNGVAAARRLGLHYLQRYFFLICFRAFLEYRGGQAFSDWVAQRREITYLLSVLELE